MSDFSRWLLPLQNPLGFGGADYLEFTVALLLLCFTLLRPLLEAAAKRFSQNARWCVLLLFLSPILLRLALLPHHPVPSPAVYDEFGHLFVADTLLHFRLANPPHPMRRFFETFFILQEPTYSSIYPLGQGLMLSAGRLLFHSPWAAVVLAGGSLSALAWWMLRAWVSPLWALLGGIFAIFEFGPLNPWMNCYWGGTLAACAGCLVFGSLPRIVQSPRLLYGVALGVGCFIHLLTRPFESIFLLASVALFFAFARRFPWRPLAIAASFVVAAGAVTLAQNRSITGAWFELPYQLSQYQYGVPAALTFQSKPVPHRELTPQQQLEYESQLSFRNTARETASSYWTRLEYRIRFYRFFFLPPLYVALLAFAFAFRAPCWLWVLVTLAIFALGANFYPFFQVHYIAALVPLFLLISVVGLQKLRAWRVGRPIATLIVFFCAAHFLFWYTLHAIENTELSTAMRGYETWNGINHESPGNRALVNRGLARLPGQLLVFVRYSPRHLFQDEWVYNAADIDASRVVWARDRGPDDNAQLIRYFPNRSVWLLDPDAVPPTVGPYRPEPQPQVTSAPPPAPEPARPKTPAKESPKPSLRFEEVK